MMISSILCLVLGISIVIFAGVPITYYLWIARNEKEVSQIEFWTIVIFSGVSTICVLVKVLFMMNIPVSVYGRLFYFIMFLYFMIFLWSKRKDTFIHNYIKAPCFLISSVLIYGLNSIVYIVYGAEYYKGYGWWDLFYYGTQAEAVRTIPFEKWATLAEQKVWMMGASYYCSGNHRISMGSLGALVAELAGVDGPSVTGFWFTMSSLMLFAAIMYATENMFVSRIKQCIACIFAVMIPGVVTSQLECFYPMVFFTSFLIFYCKCFFDYYKRGGIRRILLLSLIISAGITFLLDGTYILCGLIFTSVVWVLHSKKKYTLKEHFKKIMEIICILVLSIILNIQYMPYLWEELQWNMGRESLNGIFGFAYSPSMFNWIFYGEAQFTEAMPELLAGLLTFIAVILFICGICGLVIQTINERNGICLNFLAVFCVALLFYSQRGEHQYAFFKVLHFSFIPIVVGVFLFIEYIKKEFDKRQFVFKLWYHFISVAACVIFILCMARSFVMQLGVFPKFEKWSGRVQGYNVMSEQARNLYKEIELGDKPILLVCSNRSELQMWWASYYGRNNDVYVMGESEVNQFLKITNPDALYIAPESIASMDCKIVNFGTAADNIFPEQKRDDFAMYLEREDNMGNKNIADYTYLPEETARNYSLYIFAREATEAKMCISTDVGGKFYCNGKYWEIDENELEVVLNLKKGINKIPISNADVDFKIIEYNLHISQ